jgi:Uncharacterised nucleotidyltransferase
MRHSINPVQSYFPLTGSGNLNDAAGAADSGCKFMSAGADIMVVEHGLPGLQSVVDKISLEDQLLLYCIRSSVRSESLDNLERIIQGGVNWDYIIRAADFPHGILPLLYCTLKTISFNGVPDQFQARIQARYRQVAVDNLFLTGELLKILRSLEGQKISALAFKGPLLAVTAYGNLALRQFCDLDILVQQHDVVKTIRLLASLGYNLAEPLSDDQIRELLPRKKDLKLISRNERAVLEIHWRLVGRYFPFTFDLKRMWDDLEVAKVSGVDVLNFAPEELILFLCVHGSKHMWERLIWVSDVARVLDNQRDIDFEYLMRLAETHGCLRMVKLGLLLARTLANAQLPEGVLDTIMADKSMDNLSVQSVGMLFPDSSETNSVAGLHQFHISARERIQDKVLLTLYHLRQYARGVLHAKSH